jgi:dihydroorotase
LGIEDIRTDIYDESILPHYYCRRVEKLEPNKELIKEAILNGKEVDGARLIKTKRLTIS